MIGRKKLIELCHQLGNLLEAGVPVRRALNTIASDARPTRFRQAIMTIAAAVARGESLESAFSSQANYFPPLFLALLQVGERTGTVDRVLHHLAEYFEGQQRLIKNTLSSLIYPAVQFTLAILIIAGAKYIIGSLTSDLSEKSGLTTPLSAFGPTGSGAALLFLLQWFGGVGLIIAGYLFLTRILRGKRVVDEILLHIPLIGHTIRTLAVARFAWAFQLMMKAGLGIPECIERALDATNNAAFKARNGIIQQALHNGLGLRASLELASIFPRPLLEIVAVGETSGKIDQCLEKAAQQSFENAAFAMRTLAQVFTWLVWALVVGMLVYYILSFYLSYFGMYRGLLSGA